MPLAAILPVLSVVAAIGSSVYSAVSQSEAADEAKAAARRQEEETKKRAEAQAEQEKDRIRRNAEIMKGKQRNLLAGAGVDLNDAGGLADLTTQETDKLAQQDINTLNTNLGYRLDDASTNANRIINAQPSGGSIWGNAAMSAGSAALNAYGQYQQNNANQSLLTRQYGGSDGNGNFISGNSGVNRYGQNFSLMNYGN